MATRTKAPPLTPDAADGLTGRHLDVLMCRALWPHRKVWAIKLHAGYDRMEERAAPDEWTPETDPEQFEPWWIPEDAKSVSWSKHRYCAEIAPRFSSRIEVAWRLVVWMEEQTRFYTFTRYPEYAFASFGGDSTTAGRAYYRDCAGKAPAEKLIEAQCIAICRAVVKALCWLRGGAGE